MIYYAGRWRDSSSVCGCCLSIFHGRPARAQSEAVRRPASRYLSCGWGANKRCRLRLWAICYFCLRSAPTTTSCRHRFPSERAIPRSVGAQSCTVYARRCSCRTWSRDGIAPGVVPRSASSPPPSAFSCLASCIRAGPTPSARHVRRQARSHSRRSAAPSRRRSVPAGTSGSRPAIARASPTPSGARHAWSPRSRELQSEMGLLPVQLLRDRRSSFVELYSSRQLREDELRDGRLSRATATSSRSSTPSSRSRTKTTGRAREDRLGQDRLRGQGDSGEGRRHRRRRSRGPQRRLGDHQARADLDLPALRVEHRRSPTTSPSRSSGSATTTRRASSCRPATSASGRANGLVTCLTDGHPGVSGGGVLDQRGDLVGIPIGRMQGDYRFSFILPIRAEMLRRVTLDERTGP